MSRFPAIQHFTSWPGLCPGTKITGGKTKRVVNRASQALRLTAAALRSSNSAQGACCVPCTNAPPSSACRWSRFHSRYENP